MNVLRDFLYMFSYPYSLVRRFTSFTWSFFWTRGIVNVLPFVQRRPIEDSTSTSKSTRVKFDTSSAQSVNSGMSLKEDLESVAVSSDDKESCNNASTNSSSAYPSCQSEQASNANVFAGVAIDKGANIPNPEADVSHDKIGEALNTSSDSIASETNDVEKKSETSSPKKNDSPPPLRAKRNSTTVEEEETVAEFISVNSLSEGKQPLITEKSLDEVLLNHVSKKPKLESSQPARSRGASESDGPKTKQQKMKSKEKKNRQQYDDRPELTHFIGVQMTNPTIHSRLEEVQQKMMSKDLFHTSVRKLQKGSFFAESLVSVKKSHVTLHVFHIADDEQLEAAKTAIQKVWEKHQDEFEPEPVTLTVQGVGHFKHSVLYAKIQGQKELDKLQKISADLKEEFRGLNIYGDESKPFKAHLTLAKLSKVKRNKDFKKHNVRAFPRDLWHDIESTFFGHQRVESLQLLEMRSNQETGYYEIVETYPFNINSSITDAKGPKTNGSNSNSNSKAELDTNDNQN